LEGPLPWPISGRVIAPGEFMDTEDGV
jgi:hypothetical protein